MLLLERMTPALPSPHARLRVVGRGPGWGAAESTASLKESPPTPTSIADAMLVDPPRRFAGGGREPAASLRMTAATHFGIQERKS